MRLDIGHVAPEDEKPAQVEDEGEGGMWNVTVLDEWTGTWASESEAREHAKLINDAFEWCGR